MEPESIGPSPEFHEEEDVPADLEQYYGALQAALQAGDGDAANFFSGMIQQEVAKNRKRDIRDNTRFAERFAAGVGAGISNVGKNVADIAADVSGQEGIRPDPEVWAQERADAEPLTLGRVAGETAVLGPFGRALGAGMRALGAGTKVASPLLSKLLSSPLAASTAEGAGVGYTLGGPENRGAGSVIGAGFGAGIPLLGKFLSKPWTPSVMPTPSARYLMDQGVDLTVGQMEPGSAWAQIEEAAQSLPATGPAISAQRAKGLESWQDAVLRKVRPPEFSQPSGPVGAYEALGPGAPVPALTGESVPLPPASPGTRIPVSERLAEAYEGFGPAYEPIKKAPIRAFYGPNNTPLSKYVRDAFEGIPTDPDVMTPGPTRDMVADYLRKQATVLDRVSVSVPPGPQPPQAAGALPGSTALARQGESLGGLAATPVDDGTIPAEALLKIREGVRKKISQTLRGQQPDFAAADLLSRAEDSLTDALGQQVPPELMERLAATDAQYAKYKTLENAVAASKDAPGGFTPQNLSDAIARRTESGSYARGGGGELRDMSKAAREVFNVSSPPTGVRHVTLGTPVLKHVAGYSAALANSNLVKRALLGDYAAQRALFRAEEFAKQKGIADALRRFVVGHGVEE